MDNKKSKAVTIKDIAKALNLAPSSVARALKGSYKISKATTQRVKAYAVAHNYRPNLMAQSLKNKQSRSVGVMLSSIPNNFYAEVVNGIESVASSSDYHVMISQSHESYQKEVKGLEHLKWKLVDGLLVSLSNETEDLRHFEETIQQGIPVVFFDRVPENIQTHKVVVDNEGGSYQLVEHLIKQGYKRIAHITSSQQLSITKTRLRGYEKALTENGQPINECYIKYCSHGGGKDEEVRQAVEELLDLPTPPDAITTASDRITIKVLAILNSKEIKVPGRIAIGGFSNFGEPQLFHPPLTTVVQSAFDMGKKAMELLLQLIESKRPVKNFVSLTLPTELKIRESTLKKKR
ncbi:LacI family DNA-binding transcriptional regulator [Flavisolibacter ginsenosidimutans]|uniref:LacI family transcriptional regulator n=1 Tax=Flavisolibacter ginsenosidimutans TaxID=661481 RepID=A0A5B8UPI3_9BACT|nr:LacI family DNA-binding transcriptional regulator [Flavisolibacter ginsenosidimutans]QEC57950.1 LacI family transcriptional regulator [Flavisolibacter ginsenosidimutans]